MKSNNPLNLPKPKLDNKQSASNVIKFPVIEPVQYEIRFIIVDLDHSIPLPTIEIAEM